MQLSPKTRVDAYRRKGWWLGKSVDQIFRDSLSTNPAGPALIDAPNRQALTGTMQQVIDWAEMEGRVNALVAAMQRLGVGRDDIVVTQLPNVVEGVLFFLACARLGAILSPVALAYRGHELRQILPKLNPKIFVTIPTFHGHDHARAIVDLHANGQPTGTIICLGDEAPDGAQALGPLLVEIGSDAPGIELDPPADGADILTICWTSGTEAQPKGVPRHHDHWTVNGEAMVEAAGLKPGDRILNPFPLINIASFGGMVMPWLMMAGCLVQHHPFDLPTFLDQLQREKIAYTVAPPAVLTMLLKNTDFMNNANLTALRCLGSGSAPLAPWMVKEWQDRFGVTVMNVFGSNEGCSLFSTGAMIPDPEHRARFFPRFGAEGINWGAGFAAKIRTRLVDLDTNADITKPDQIGELRIDGAMTFDGYWQADQLNKLAFDDQGYFKTGDLFEIAAEGNGRFYQFVGRSKEIVIRGGQNISPAEVDTLIEGHPAIREASCVGYPDERLGERICAVVVLKPGCKLSLEELCTFLKQADVAVYKLPERLKIVEALPRNALGKVLRRELAPIALAI